MEFARENDQFARPPRGAGHELLEAVKVDALVRRDVRMGRRAVTQVSNAATASKRNFALGKLFIVESSRSGTTVLREADPSCAGLNQ